MEAKSRLDRIVRRARMVHRIRNGVEGVLVVAIIAAAAAFLVMLLVGLGYVSSDVWRMAAPAIAVGLAGGALIGALRRLDDHRVLRRVDEHHGLGNALTVAREFLMGPADRMTPLATAHIKQALARAEEVAFTRTVTANLGAPARILGILCVCLISVALI